MKNNKRLIVIDLFAGAGGLLLGFEQAGFETISANENDKKAVEMLKFNYPWVSVIDKDIHQVKAVDLLCGYKIGEIDVLVGGPPCQGFSLIGLREQGDPRNNLVFQFVKMLKEIRPKTFLMENVPGILSTHKGEFVKELLRQFDKAGYEVREPKILHADDYGVPQRRSRVIFMGWRKELNISINYPEPTHYSPRSKRAKTPQQKVLFEEQLKPTPLVKDAIEDLPNIDEHEHLVGDDKTPYEMAPKSEYAKIMRGIKKDPDDLSQKRKWNNKICTGCRRTVHGVVLTERCKKTPQGETLPVSRLYKLKWNDVANTLRAGTPRERGAYSAPRPIHSIYPRVISVREGARLQSFPDWIRFDPTKWHGFRQVGNSVPPLLARAIAKQYRKALSAKL